MLFVIIFASGSVPAFACPLCKDSTVDSGTSASVGASTQSSSLDFNKSIYIMLGGFAGAAAFTGRVMYKAAKSSLNFRDF